MTHVLFSASAKSDLSEAWLLIAEESVDAADGVIEAIHREAQTLSLQPLMGRLRSKHKF
jgi:plasmid stabilization system protein ParE